MNHTVRNHTQALDGTVPSIMVSVTRMECNSFKHLQNSLHLGCDLSYVGYHVCKSYNRFAHVFE